MWTEPHSKRIKVRLTVQREFNGAIVEGSFLVQFVVQFNMCPECSRANTNQESWSASVQVRRLLFSVQCLVYYKSSSLQGCFHSVKDIFPSSYLSECETFSDHFRVGQVRQHTSHKKTFLFLEQLILKHAAHENTLAIKEMHEVVHCTSHQCLLASGPLAYLEKTTTHVFPIEGQQLLYSEEFSKPSSLC